MRQRRCRSPTSRSPSNAPSATAPAARHRSTPRAGGRPSARHPLRRPTAARSSRRPLLEPGAVLHVQGVDPLGPVDLADASHLRGDESPVADLAGSHCLVPCTLAKGNVPREVSTMRAMVLDAAGAPLRLGRASRTRSPRAGQVLLRVLACGVCRTDLHIVDGELEQPEAPARPRPPDRRRSRERRRAVRRRARASESPGSAGPAAIAATASAGRRTSATAPASPATTSTAATPSSPSPTSATASRSPPATRTTRRRRCSAPVSSATARCGSPATRSGSACTASAPPRTSSARSRWRRDATCSPERAPATTRRRRSRRSLGAVWAGDALAGPPEELDAVIVFAPVGDLVPAALRAVERAAPWSARAST